MAKQLVFNEEARRAVLRGAEILAKAVKVTLGPKEEMSLSTKIRLAHDN